MVRRVDTLLEAVLGECQELFVCHGVASTGAKVISRRNFEVTEVKAQRKGPRSSRELPQGPHRAGGEYVEYALRGCLGGFPGLSSG